jgi:hypothetical protein
MGKSIGKMLVEFRRASNEFKRTIEDEVEAEKVRPAQAPVTPAAREALAGAGETAAKDAFDGPAAAPTLAPPEGTVAKATPAEPPAESPSQG